MQVHKLVSIILLALIMVGCQQATKERTPAKRSEPILPKQKINFHNHIVKKGESLYTIAREYKTSMVDIVIDNNLVRNQEVLAGKVLKVRVPLGVNVNQELPLLKKTIGPLVEEPKGAKSTPSENLSKGKHFSGNIPYMLIPKGTGYQKSIKGIISKNFQDNHFGRPLLGIEVRSSNKQNVKAIHNGVVAFIAESFAGYGRSIAVASARNEIFFIYGLDSISVKIGDVVNKGDSIGTISSGKTLGLKILRKGIFQDPDKLIQGLK